MNSGGHSSPAGAPGAVAALPSEPQRFVDRHLIDRLTGATLELHPPERR